MQANFINGWREVLARIFDGLEAEHGVTPEWLINPETHRRLKLDYLFPNVGVAVRFVGLEGGGQRPRKSDEELLTETEREAARAEVCREHGVVLVSINPDGEPIEAIRSLETGLARAAAQLAQSSASQDVKRKLMPQISLARRKAGEYRNKLGQPERLNLYAEMWWDRQAQLAAQAPPRKPAGKPRSYQVGMSVSHERFGPGQVVSVSPDGADMAITVDFVAAGTRTFYASLVADKLLPD